MCKRKKFLNFLYLVNSLTMTCMTGGELYDGELYDGELPDGDLLAVSFPKLYNNDDIESVTSCMKLPSRNCLSRIGC